jgi:hypothetical protein
MIYAITEPQLHLYEYYEIEATNEDEAREKLFAHFDRDVETTKQIFEGKPDQARMVSWARDRAETKKINTDFMTHRYPEDTYERV